MFRVKIPRVRMKGAPRFVDWADKIVTSVENLWNVSATGNATVTIDPKTGINIHVPAFPVAVAKTTSSVSARAGATPGSGTATLQMFNGTSLMDDAARANQTVYNFSANATGVATGKYCIIIKVFGYWFIVAVEC